MCCTIHDNWALEPFFNSFSFFFIFFFIYVRRDQNSKPYGRIVYVHSRVCLAIRLLCFYNHLYRFATSMYIIFKYLGYVFYQKSNE